MRNRQEIVILALLLILLDVYIKYPSLDGSITVVASESVQYSCMSSPISLWAARNLKNLISLDERTQIQHSTYKRYAITKNYVYTYTIRETHSRLDRGGICKCHFGTFRHPLICNDRALALCAKFGVVDWPTHD